MSEMSQNDKSEQNEQNGQKWLNQILHPLGNTSLSNNLIHPNQTHTILLT